MRFLFAFLIFITSAHAQVGELKPFTSLCKEENSVGFNWESGKWVPSRFRTSEFTVRKIGTAEFTNNNKTIAISPTASCKEVPLNTAFQNKVFGSGCYEFKDGNADSNLVFGIKMCSEFWEGGTLKKINCGEHFPAFSFLPNGSFIKGHRETDVALDTKLKTPLTVSVGQCSVVQ